MRVAAEAHDQASSAMFGEFMRIKRMVKLGHSFAGLVKKQRRAVARSNTLRLVVGFGLLALLLPIGYAQTTHAAGEAGSTPAIDDPQTILSGRSPGARGDGWLYQTKMPLTAAARLPETESFRTVAYALGLPPADDWAGSDLDGSPPFLAEPSDIARGSELSPPIFFGGGFDDDLAVGPWPGGEVSPGPGPGGPGPATPANGGPGPTPGPQLPNPSPETGSVPEPDVWLTMMTGLLLTGSVLRRRHTTAAASRDRTSGSYPVASDS